jgi:aminoglycoside phosphotransferase (APT) family kinase protein
MNIGEITIDEKALESFFTANVEGARPPLNLEPLGGGSSNYTYLVRSGENAWVMRHGPPGHGLATAHDMLREYTVLAAVAPAGVPAPMPYAYCEDAAITGAPFYVMEYRQGVLIADKPPVAPPPPGYADTLEQRKAIGVGLIDAMVALHAVDYEKAGLGDFGRPEGYLQRQVDRWVGQWEQWKTREMPEADMLIAALRASVPESPAPTVVHGDFRLGNLILDAKDPGKVVAILDWEMAALGDPLMDLGYSFLYWGEAGDDPLKFEAMDLASATALPGFLTRRELAELYAERTGRDVSNVTFYEALAYLKIAAMHERGYNRYLHGLQSGEYKADEYREASRIRCDALLRVGARLAGNIGAH